MSYGGPAPQMLGYVLPILTAASRTPSWQDGGLRIYSQVNTKPYGGTTPRMLGYIIRGTAPQKLGYVLPIRTAGRRWLSWQDGGLRLSSSSSYLGLPFRTAAAAATPKLKIRRGLLPPFFSALTKYLGKSRKPKPTIRVYLLLMLSFNGGVQSRIIVDHAHV